jgi:hypothetical protein
MKTKAQLMEDLKDEITNLLIEIEDTYKRFGLPLSQITLIARDPANDNMIILLTNETEVSLDHAIKLALKQKSTK